MQVAYPAIERRRNLSGRAFRRDYVGRRPVVLEGVVGGLGACSWTLDLLAERAGDVGVKVKRDSVDQPTRVEEMRLAEYRDALFRASPSDTAPAPYLHDTPLLERARHLRDDFDGFPTELFPEWYRSSWWRFALFFAGGDGSLTPLHIDSLETHNLFFQLAGHKRFVVVPARDAQHCYRRDWRWSPVDAEAPDLRRFPRFAAARPLKCTLVPGDGLYLPPRTFHQVRGMGDTISFNLDWHDRASAWRGVAAVGRGMPLHKGTYNLLHAMGLTVGIPPDWIYPLYRRHLDSVD